MERSLRGVPVGVGGKPWIFAGFTDGDANLLSEATLLGRCEQLSKALN
jgi:hypothetical protein